MAWQETTQMVGKLNGVLRGWANYFQVGTVSRSYRAIDSYTAAARRAGGCAPNSRSGVNGAGAIPPQSCTTASDSSAWLGGGATDRGRRREVLSESRMLGDLHVRFDERDVETERRRGYSGTARRKGLQQTNRT